MVQGKGNGLSGHESTRSLISDTDGFADYSRSLMNYQIAEFLSDTISYCAFADLSNNARTWRGEPGLLEELARELELLERQILVSPFFDMAASAGLESRIHLARFICSLILNGGSKREQHPLHELAHAMVNVWEAPPPHVKMRLSQFLAGSQRAMGIDDEVLQRLIDVMARSLIMERIRQRINFAAELVIETSLGRMADALRSNADEARFDTTALVSFFQRVLKITVRFNQEGIIVGHNKETMLITV